MTLVVERPDLDLLSSSDIVERLLGAEERVVPAVRRQRETIAAAADLIAERMRAGGRLVLFGAGTSGRLAVVEAAELPGTFGLARDRVLSCVAGGPGGTDDDEDDLELATRDLAAIDYAAADVAVAVAASGSTPYTLDVARAARTHGAAVVSVACVAGSALAQLADVAIELPVGDEVLRGSTRLTAGTAQKVALNALTTAAMVRLGRVHGDQMVDVVAANAKLRGRAAGIVSDIVGCSVADAEAALDACHGNARAAVVHLALGLDPVTAAAHAARHITLRDALAAKP